MGAVTSPTITALEESLSTVTSSRMKTSSSSTPDQESSPWLTPALEPTALSSSSTPSRPHGWTVSTSCLATSLMVWMSSRRSKPSGVKAGRHLKRSSSPTAASSKSKKPWDVSRLNRTSAHCERTFHQKIDQRKLKIYIHPSQVCSTTGQFSLSSRLDTAPAYCCANSFNVKLRSPLALYCSINYWMAHIPRLHVVAFLLTK